ncbi:MAG: hypothetical protein KAR44_14850 [Candidatus Aegiribacteria sp.]|nr:hypothetical protein [Candidatus Aegiribacteria sp.]
MEDLEIIRKDIKALLTSSSSQETRLGHIENHLSKLNGSVAKNSKKIGVIEVCLKYNKGVIVGVLGIVSVFWSIITYLG